MSELRHATTACESLDCDEVAELLPLIADGALDADDDPALFDHVARCPACQAELATHDLVSLTLERQTSANGAIRSATTSRSEDGKVIRFRLPLAAAAAWFLAIGGAITGGITWLGQEDPPASSDEGPEVMVLEESPDQRRGQQQFRLRVGHDIIETPAQDGSDPRGNGAGSDGDRPPEFTPVGRKRH